MRGPSSAIDAWFLWFAISLGVSEISRSSASYTATTYLSLFGLAITVPLLLLLGALLLQSASAQREQLESRALQVLDALVNDIDRDLDRDMTILRTLATSEALANQDWPTFYDQAQAGLQGRAYLVLLDSTGRQLVNTYVPYGKQPAMTGDPETVRRMRESKAPVVSNLFVSLVVKKPVFNVSIPILADGQLRYVISLGLLPDDLVALLASQNLGPEWVALVWDAHGAILARSRDHARYLGRPLPQNMREGGERAAVRTKNLDGTDVLHATARSQLSGWGVGVNVPYALITGQMRNSLLLWGAAAALASAVALALGLFFARQIASSLAVASKAAVAFGHGESFPVAGSRLKEADAFLATLKDAQEGLAKAQSHQKLLVRELQHRTQNLFMVIQAIIRRSLGEAQTVAQAKDVILGRLAALSGTHAILAGAAWEGAPLGEIVKREFGVDSSSAVDVSGCDIVVNAGAAHHFALIIHELATNALKYGALSVPGGRISVAGSVEQANGVPQFCLRWSESGGPPVAKPTRKGFGSVILFEVAKQFGMDVSVDFDPKGLRYELRVPVKAVAASSAGKDIARALVPE
jgi:two-component sensor histidine kinase